MMWIAWSPQVSSRCPEARARAALPGGWSRRPLWTRQPRSSPESQARLRPVPPSQRTVTDGPPCPTGLFALRQSAWGGGRRFLSAALTLVGHPISELSSLSESPEGSKYRKVNA